MLKVHEVVRHGYWPAATAADTITLDETGRHRRRMRMVGEGGTEFLLDLPGATLLRHGDGLLLEDGRIVEVLAEPEALYEVRAGDPSAQALLRLAWHLGNRHLPSQIFADHILIRRDHVIKVMLEGLGARVTEFVAPFDPEGGAYGEAAPHAHGHDQAPHDDGHGHSHDDH